MTSCPVVDRFDPLAPDYLRGPFAVLAGIPVDETNISFRGPQALWLEHD